jgi:hypothetical protein
VVPFFSTTHATTQRKAKRLSEFDVRPAQPPGADEREAKDAQWLIAATPNWPISGRLLKGGKCERACLQRLGPKRDEIPIRVEARRERRRIDGMRVEAEERERAFGSSLAAAAAAAAGGVCGGGGVP